MIEPCLVEKQLGAEHLDHVGAETGNRFEQVQRFQLFNGGRVLAGALVEFLEELLLNGRPRLVAGGFHLFVGIRQFCACAFALVIEFGQLLFELGDALSILLFQRLASTRQTTAPQTQARIDKPITPLIADQCRAAA
ncbi:hypothetical protein D3C86_1741780 [compost metagenome]